MNSSIFEGTVVHARQQPEHQFSYRLFMMFIDLDEMPSLFKKNPFWSMRFPNLAWFRRKDFLGDQHTCLAESVRNLVQKRTGIRPDGPVRLLTNLRYFGFLINPISLYYCFDLDEELEFVIAEVTNTPWGEKHSYVLDLREQELPTRTAWAEKSLHVSPFKDMDYEYRFTVSPPADQLRIRIENHRMENQQLGAERNSPSFFAALAMKRVPITGWSLSSVLLRYPLMTVQILVAIYWQALRLHIKGARFFAHPGKENQANDSKAIVVTDSEVLLEELESTSQ